MDRQPRAGCFFCLLESSFLSVFSAFLPVNLIIIKKKANKTLFVEKKKLYLQTFGIISVYEC